MPGANGVLPYDAADFSSLHISGITIILNPLYKIFKGVYFMKKLNRWVYAIVGVIVLIFAGLIYAWSVLASPIAASTGWQPDSMSLTFTIAMSFFCLGGLVGGLLNGKINVRVNVIAAAVLFLLGFFITSRTSSIAMLYFGFGVCSGFASGLAYNAVMSTISTWFPDKQ